MRKPRVAKRNIGQALFARAVQNAEELRDELAPALEKAIKKLIEFQDMYGILPADIGIEIMPNKLLFAGDLALASAPARRKRVAKESAEKRAAPQAEKPARKQRRRKAKKQTKAKSRKKSLVKMPLLADTKKFVLKILKSFKVGDQFKNADVYESALADWMSANNVTAREKAVMQFPPKCVALAMSRLKGVKRRKIQNKGTPPLVVYTASRNMHF